MQAVSLSKFPLLGAGGPPQPNVNNTGMLGLGAHLGLRTPETEATPLDQRWPYRIAAVCVSVCHANSPLGGLGEKRGRKINYGRKKE